MTPLKIQYELKKRGITQRSLAAELGITKMPVSKVINKLIVSDRVMRAVSAKIGKDHRMVFPEYYLQTGKAQHKQGA